MIAKAAAVGEYIESLSIAELKALVSQLIDRMITMTSRSSGPDHQSKRRCSDSSCISTADKRKLLSGKYLTSRRVQDVEVKGVASSSSAVAASVRSESEDSMDHPDKESSLYEMDHPDKESSLLLLSTVAQLSMEQQPMPRRVAKQSQCNE